MEDGPGEQVQAASATVTEGRSPAEMAEMAEQLERMVTSLVLSIETAHRLDLVQQTLETLEQMTEVLQLHLALSWEPSGTVGYRLSALAEVLQRLSARWGAPCMNGLTSEEFEAIPELTYNTVAAQTQHLLNQLLASSSGTDGTHHRIINDVRRLHETLLEGGRIGAPEECVICCQRFEDGDLLKALPCSTLAAPHAFHTDCVRPWLARDRSCPLCRECIEPCLSTTSSESSMLPPTTLLPLATLATLPRLAVASELPRFPIASESPDSPTQESPSSNSRSSRRSPDLLPPLEQRSSPSTLISPSAEATTRTPAAADAPLGNSGGLPAARARPRGETAAVAAAATANIALPRYPVNVPRLRRTERPRRSATPTTLSLRPARPRLASHAEQADLEPRGPAVNRLSSRGLWGGNRSTGNSRTRQSVGQSSLS